MGRIKCNIGPHCVLCEGPMRTGTPHLRPFRSEDRPYNRSRHAWMTRFRILGLLDGECFMTGQAQLHRYHDQVPKCKLGNYLNRGETDLCCTKDDGLINIPGYWSLMLNPEPVLFVKIHDSCLVMMARVFHDHLLRRELNDSSFSKFTVNESMMYDALGRASSSVSTKFYVQYDRRACAYQDFFLDPLHIPELEALAAAPPRRSPIPGNGFPISRLPAEIALMIISHLNLKHEVSLAAADILPAELFRDWAMLLQDDMPWLFELELLDKSDTGINWALIYVLCRWDTEFVHVGERLARRMQHEEIRPGKLADIDPQIEQVARQIHERYGSIAKTDFSAEDDLMDQHMLDLDDVEPPPRNKREEEERKPCRFDCSDPPRFPGLSNRRRIWKLCRIVFFEEDREDDEEEDEIDEHLGFVD